MGRHKSRRGGKFDNDDDEFDRPQPEEQDLRRPARPPEIFLRMCRWDEAHRRLDQQVRAHVRQGRREILVVHGRGQGSPDGQGVLGSAVREWCNAHRDLVIEWRSAPPSWGGDGAIVLTLNV